MSKFSIMPDLPEECIKYLDNGNYLMIYNNEFLIKKEYQSDVYIDVIEKLTKIKIPSFRFPEKIFADQYDMFYFIVSKYLCDYYSLLKKLKLMEQEDIVLLFQKLLLSLKNAHDNGFNPFDITYTNYLIDDLNNPIFIDIEDSFYEGMPTSKYICQTSFDISYFNQNKEDFCYDNLNLSDKMCLLNMLMQSLLQQYKAYNTPENLVTNFSKLKKTGILSGDIVTYLENIILKKEKPQKDDYFINDLILPLSEVLKRKR